MLPSHLSNLRAVVFDFDGTLAETKIDFALMRRRTVEHITAWGLWETGLDEGRYVLEMIDHSARQLAADPPRQGRYRVEAAQILEDVEMLTCARAQPFPGTAEALQCLADHHLAVGIITRNCRRAVRAVLDRHHLHHDALLTREDVARVKPDAAHLLAALDLLAVTPPETLMVGDHPTDIQCGRAAGALTCGVLTDRTTREQHEQAGADLVVDSVAALAAVLCPARTGEPPQ